MSREHTQQVRAFSSPEACRKRICDAAEACLDAIGGRADGATEVDRLTVRMALAALVFPARTISLLEEIRGVAVRAAAARERIADPATPLSDMHAWTDQLDLCRAQVPNLRARLAETLRQ